MLICPTITSLSTQGSFYDNIIMIIYNGKVSNLLFGGHFVYMAAILDNLYLLRWAAKHQVHLLGHLEYKDMTFSDI